MRADVKQYYYWRFELAEDISQGRKVSSQHQIKHKTSNNHTPKEMFAKFKTQTKKRNLLKSCLEK